MNPCDAYEALLDAFAEGDLFTEDMIRVQQHLNHCPNCQSYLEDLLTIQAAFPSVEDTVVPESFSASVMAAVAALPQDAPVAPARKKTPWTKVLLPLAACFALMVVVGTMPGMNHKNAAAPAAAKMAMEETVEEAKVVCEEAPAEAEIYAYTSTTSSTAAPAKEKGAVEARQNTASEYQSELTADTAAAAPAETPAAEGTLVFDTRMELPAEASRFLEGFSPAAETAAEIHYHLSAEEFSTLQSQLADAGLVAIVEEGVDANTDMVLVVLKK